VSPSITVVCERPDDSTSWRSLSGGSTQKRMTSSWTSGCASAPPRLANIITCPVLPPRRLRAFERFIASCVSRQLCLRRMTPRAVR
jgi:hypothetical protein